MSTYLVLRTYWRSFESPALSSGSHPATRQPAVRAWVRALGGYGDDGRLSMEGGMRTKEIKKKREGSETYQGRTREEYEAEMGAQCGSRYKSVEIFQRIRDQLLAEGRKGK